jgi:hypothetical protein
MVDGRPFHAEIDQAEDEEPAREGAKRVFRSLANRLKAEL